MKIICMGDSITYGHSLSDLSQRWTDLVAARTGHALVNRGVSGDTTGGMLARCQNQVFAQFPDAMILLGGINDINLTGQYRPVCANVAAIARQAMALELPILIGLPLPIVPEDLKVMAWDKDCDPFRSAGLCEQYAEWLRAFCASKELPLVDFRSPFLQADGTVRRELFQDGLHPTAEGHALMAEELCRVLAEVF